jgi:hypothetical protein
MVSIGSINATLLYIMFVTMNRHLLFWSFGFPMLQQIKESYSTRTKQVPSTQSTNMVDAVKDWMNRVALSPIMLAIYCGVFIGLVPPIKNALFNYTSAIRFGC